MKSDITAARGEAMSYDLIPQIHLGQGNTVFHFGERDGRYFVEFRNLERDGEPGSTVSIEKSMNAKTYFVITFSDIRSLGVLARVVLTLHREAKNRATEVTE